MNDTVIHTSTRAAYAAVHPTRDQHPRPPVVPQRHRLAARLRRVADRLDD